MFVVWHFGVIKTFGTIKKMRTIIHKSKQITIGITTNDVEKSKRIFEALQQDGTVNMPFGEQPFSPGFGDVTDKFGMTFHVYTEI